MEFKVVQKELELKSRGWIPTFHDVSKEVMELLMGYDWPGNVRELKQAVQSAVLFAQGELVTAEELNLDESGKPSDPDIALKGECMEKKRICQALEKAGHNRKEAARLLGISRSTLYEKMDLYGIQTKR